MSLIFLTFGLESLLFKANFDWSGFILLSLASQFFEETCLSSDDFNYLDLISKEKFI
jgi:hypothetical protein